MIPDVYLYGALMVGLWLCGYILGQVVGYRKGFEEGAAIWKSCLEDVRNIYRGKSN